jgi:thiol-disulfide isomerase/thioredoxin
MKKFQVLLVFLLFSCFGLLSQGYRIQVKLKDFPNDTVVIGHRFNASFVPKDTTVLDKQGNGIFSGKEPLPQGMYLIYLPNKNYFDLLIGNDQEFYVENDTLDFINNIIIKGSDENTAFYKYQQYLQMQSKKAREIQDMIKAASNKEESDKLKKELDLLNEEVMDYINQVIVDNQGNFFGTFVKSLQDINVPDPPRDEKGNISDSTFQYRYYKNHYWDNFDPSDVRLLRTPFYEQKLMTYIEKVVYQIPDSLIKEVDMLIEKSRTDPQLFRYMLITLFNYYAKSQIMGMDAVYIHIAEKYYIPEASWSDKDFIEKLKDRVEKSKPTLIGQTAHDIQLVNLPSDHFIAAADDEELKKNPYLGTFFNLYDVKAEYIILFFWEADCGHCKTATPELYKIYEELKDKDVKVVAVNLLGGEEGKVKWINFVNEHGLYDWINCWNPYDFEFKKIYDIVTTPALFILDRDKKIIAKKITPEQAKEIILSLLASK